MNAQTTSIKKAGTWLLAACLATTASAQTPATDSLHALLDQRLTDHFGFTGNAASISEQPAYGYARASASAETGDFKRPMQPGVADVYGLSTGGNRKKGRWNMMADFTYQKQFHKQVAWTAVSNPYSGNPFIWADSSSGKWDRDEVYITAAAAVAVSKKWKTGIAIDYRIGTGARTSEPKPFYRRRDITLKPGVTFRLSASEELGATLGATFTQEENEIGYYSNSNVLLYRLRGYGTFSKSPFVSGERKQTGTGWRGGMHYSKRWRSKQLVLQAAVAQIDEEVTEGVARPQTIGYFTSVSINVKARLYSGNMHKGNSLEVMYNRQNGYADDMLFRAENASFVRQHLQVAWSIWHQYNGRSLLQWTAIPALHYADYTDQASFMQWFATTIGGDVQAHYRYQLNDHLKLAVKSAIGYYQVTDDGFTSRAQNTVIKQLVRPDYQFMASNYWKANCQLQIQWGGNKSSLSHLLGLSGEFRRSVNTVFSHRTLYQIQYSILF